jgi:hypothetical protein
MSGKTIRPIDAEIFSERTEGNFPSGYLTLVSIIQGAALGLLAYREGGILFSEDGTLRSLDPGNMIYLVVSLGLIVVVTHEYIWFFGVFRWMPKIRDTAIPLLLGYCELNMALAIVQPPTATLNGWWLSVFGVCLVSLLAYANSRWNCRDIFTRDNTEAQMLTNESLNKDIAVSAFGVLFSLAMVGITAKHKSFCIELVGCIVLTVAASYIALQGQRLMDRLPEKLK